jgi:type II secretory ATPase GspE/PulE/Tfp pilus assembly ATPase PilB-like protein
VTETSTLVRLRIDGDLSLFMTLSKQEYKLILERLKYKSDLKLNITNIPQDGKFKIQTPQLNLDVRVSTLPVKNGESVVARILDSGNQIPKLEELGFQWTAKRQIDRCLKKNSGMILVT